MLRTTAARPGGPLPLFSSRAQKPRSDLSRVLHAARVCLFVAAIVLFGALHLRGRYLASEVEELSSEQQARTSQLEVRIAELARQLAQLNATHSDVSEELALAKERIVELEGSEGKAQDLVVQLQRSLKEAYREDLDEPAFESESVFDAKSVGDTSEASGLEAQTGIVESDDASNAIEQGLVPRANLTAEDAVTILAKALLFPCPAAANPIRHAWLDFGLDWHNLVRPGPEIATNDAAAAAKQLYRFHREASKADLISLLQGYLSISGDVSSGDDFVSRVSTDASNSDANSETELSSYRSPTVNHGSMAKYAACPIVRDKCMIHSTAAACVDDELCGWCPSPGTPYNNRKTRSTSSGLCVDRFPSGAYWPEPETKQRVRVCPGPLYVTRQSVPSLYFSESQRSKENPAAAKMATSSTGQSQIVFQLVGGRSAAFLRGVEPSLHKKKGKIGHNSSDSTTAGAGATEARTELRLPNCSVVITRRRPLLLSLTGDSSMAYHFWTQTAHAWYADATDGSGLEHLRQHVWIDPASFTDYLHLTHLFSDSCWRYTGPTAKGSGGYDIPAGASICYANKESAPQLVKRAYSRRRRRGSTSNSAGSEDAESANFPASVRLTGLAGPELVAIDHTTGLPLEPLQTNEGDLLKLSNVQSSVSLGFRLGLSGLAEAVGSFRHFADALSHYDGTGEGLITVPAQLAQQLAPLLSADQLRRVPAAATSLSATIVDSSISSFPGFIVYSLGLWDVLPKHLQAYTPPAAPQRRGKSPVCKRPRPLVVLLSRRNKRFLMNEPELVASLLAMRWRDVLPSLNVTTAAAAAAVAAADAPATKGTKRLNKAKHTGLNAEVSAAHRGLIAKEESASSGEAAAAGSGYGTLAVHPWGVRPAPPHNVNGDDDSACLADDVSPAVDVEVATLEDMPLFEQISLFRRASVLLGVHGSGLVNSIFMHPGTALVQLMPRGVTTGAAFFQGPASGAGVRYFEYIHRPDNGDGDASKQGQSSGDSGSGDSGFDGSDWSPDITVGEGGAGKRPGALGRQLPAAGTTAVSPDDESPDADSPPEPPGRDVNHWHFLDGSFAKRKGELLRGSADCCGQGVFFTFFINRDMIVPASDLVGVVTKALRAVLKLQ